MSEQELHDSRKRFEEGQISRRAALRKLGITAGAAFFSMFMLDDLARIAANRLDQYRGDSKLADSLAREFHNAGVAFAAGSTPCNAWEAFYNDTKCDACNSVVYNKCVGIEGVGGPCDTWASQCDKFCSQGSTQQNYDNWYNCWNGYNTSLP